MSYRLRALQELGLAGPGLKQKLRHRVSPEEIKEEAHRVGRKLLGKYHPDRNKDPDAAPMFQAVKDVLEHLDNLPLPSEAPAGPRIRYSVTFYPERGPSGGHVKTQTVRTTYFDREEQKSQSSGVQYDATRVVPMRPKSRK